MSDPNVHIAAWEAAGLIDAPLAERLRQASTEVPTEPAEAVASPGATVAGAPESRAGSALSFFGPSVVVVEMFAYLGTAFLLAAWLVFLATVAQPGARHREAIITGGLGLAALILFGLGVLLVRGDPRRRRAAGVAFAATTILAAGAAAYFVQLDFIINVLQWAAPEVLIGLVAVILATFLRSLLASVTTQFSLVASITTFAAALLAWVDQLVHPANHGGAYVLNPPPPAPDPIALVQVAAAWWLLVALGLGIIGRFEARRAEADQGAGRRAALTRFWAGLVAVGGVAQALTQSGNTGGFNYGRLLEPWIADVVILIVAAVLVERAFRRDSNAYILSAAIGLIIALTDFNFSYLAQTTYVGLLIEGAILLAVGFAGDRFRRQLHRAALPAAGPVLGPGSGPAPGAG